MIGKKIETFLDWETGRICMKHFRKAIASGKSEFFELDLEENGNKHCYEIQISPIDRDRVIMTAHDIPQAYISQLELERTQLSLSLIHIYGNCWQFCKRINKSCTEPGNYI